MQRWLRWSWTKKALTPCRQEKDPTIPAVRAPCSNRSSEGLGQFRPTCVLTLPSPRVLPPVLPPPGAIEKLAKEDPRRARTGQILDDRIAAKRSELRKGSKKAKSKASAAAASAAADSGEDKDEDNDGVGQKKEESASAQDGDSMDEEEEEDGDGGKGPDAGKDGEGAELESGDEGDDDDDGEEEEAQEGLEEDNLREMHAGGRGKVSFCVRHS